MGDQIEKAAMSGPVVTDLSYLVKPPQTDGSSTWLGPLQPMNPVAPQAAGRALDYPTGYNLNTTPRPYEDVNFATLRALADNCEILRIVLERKKDQIVRLPWSIRARHDGPSYRRPKLAQLPSAQRERIRDIDAFFRTPDYQVGFTSFLRQLLEDLLVIDAPSIFCDRDHFGQLVALQVTDGATIKRVIDQRGRVPRPIRWTGAPFEWNGQTITADTAMRQGFHIAGGIAFPPCYQQILHGLPAVNYTTRDLLYRPMNLRPGHLFGCSPVQQIMNTVTTAIRRAQHQLSYYEEGNQPESIYSLPTSWTPDQVQKFQDYFDNLYTGNLAQRRRMKFLAGDNAKNNYVALKEPPLTSEMDHWLARVICLAMSYPVSALVPNNNRATAEQAERTAEEEGVEPIKGWFSDLANEIIQREFGADDVEFAWAETDEPDSKRQAEVLTMYADSGALTLNEVRERIGAEPMADPAASVLAVKTSTGRVPIAANASDAKVTA